MCTMCVQGPRKPERVWDPLELKRQKVLQEPWECWEQSAGPLPEGRMLITTLQDLGAF